MSGKNSNKMENILEKMGEMSKYTSFTNLGKILCEEEEEVQNTEASQENSESNEQAFNPEVEKEEETASSGSTISFTDLVGELKRVTVTYNLKVMIRTPGAIVSFDDKFSEKDISYTMETSFKIEKGDSSLVLIPSEVGKVIKQSDYAWIIYDKQNKELVKIAVNI